MYTVLWTELNRDYWDRCESRSEVAALLIEHGLEEDPDVLIFGPDADDSIVSVEDVFASL